jgi:long-chain fatty acid transport protein
VEPSKGKGEKRKNACFLTINGDTIVQSAAASRRHIPRNAHKYKEENMRKIITVVLVLGLVAAVAPQALATNGDNLIGIGPISRAMGGVGIAFPQDAISATFANPAGMCFGPYCPGSEFNFGGTLFMPKVDAKVQALGQTFKADSDDKVYAIPAIGVSWPISTKLRAGLSAYGVSGLGVDYRDTAIDNPTAFQPTGPAGLPQFPLIQGEYTQLQIMKFAPTVAYQISDALSVGAAVHITYANLDLRNGSSFNYAFGIQPGVLFKPMDWLYLGATYVSAQSVDYENVIGTLDPATGFGAFSADLELEQPQEVGLGVAVEPILGKLLLEVNYKWIDWSSAEGYEQFDWDSQNVVSVGAQFKPTEQLALRVGYNYGENPVKEHNGWDGTLNMMGQPNDVVNVQGTPFPRYYYETFRIIGFPAIVEHHITAGIGYEVSEKFALNLGYMHAFEETIKETGTDFFGNTAVLESTLSEDSLEFGMTWRF